MMAKDYTIDLFLQKESGGWLYWERNPDGLPDKEFKRLRRQLN